MNNKFNFMFKKLLDVKQNNVELVNLESRYKKDLAAVKKDDYALYHVEEQTSEICLEAVKQDRRALQHVNEKFKYLF
jgi:hypothetical protein